jgi:hypothetical protein
MNKIIEVNGHRYDAKTGKLINGLAPDNNSNQIITHSNMTGKVMDGVSKRRPNNNPLKPVKKLNTPKNPPIKQINTRDTNNIVSKNTEKSKILQRNIVKKPVSSQYLAPQENLPSESYGHISNLIKKVSPDKLSRAKQVEKAEVVNKYSKNSNPQANSSPSLKVEASPKSTDETPTLPIFGRIKRPKKSSKAQVFKHSLENANAHKIPKVKKERLFRRISKSVRLNPKALGVVASCFAILILGGFLAYQNVPSIAMRVAANRAGFGGHIPGDIPTGFAFKGPINASKGVIQLKYKSNSDDRKFSITQKPTSWTSESLLTDYLLASNIKYQTYHDKGLTVYVYNEGSATWVDKGVWYSINGQGSLSSDQILAIAGSM